MVKLGKECQLLNMVWHAWFHCQIPVTLTFTYILAPLCGIMGLYVGYPCIPCPDDILINADVYATRHSRRIIRKTFVKMPRYQSLANCFIIEDQLNIWTCWIKHISTHWTSFDNQAPLVMDDKMSGVIVANIAWQDKGDIWTTRHGCIEREIRESPPNREAWMT